jgi:hypothetical protein
MRSALLSTSLAFVLVTVTFADDTPEKKTPEKMPEEKVIPVAILHGTIKTASESSRELTLKVDIHTLEPNREAQADYVRRQQQLIVRQQQILNNPNPVQRQQQMVQLVRDAQELMKAQANLFKIKTTYQDVTLTLAQDVKIRSTFPPQEFDNKGNIKVYTPAELKELRGTSGLPGFEASMEVVTQDRPALVKIVRRAAPSEASKEKESPSMADKDKALKGLEISIVLVGVPPVK